MMSRGGWPLQSPSYQHGHVPHHGVVAQLGVWPHLLLRPHYSPPIINRASFRSPLTPVLPAAPCAPPSMNREQPSVTSTVGIGMKFRDYKDLRQVVLFSCSERTPFSSSGPAAQAPQCAGRGKATGAGQAGQAVRWIW